MCITVWLILESVRQLKLINAVQFVTIINVSNAFTTLPQCLEIIEKVAFNNASEASYVYILSRQKFMKNAKNGPFWRLFENLKIAVKQCYQTGQSR